MLCSRLTLCGQIATRQAVCQSSWHLQQALVSTVNLPKQVHEEEFAKLMDNLHRLGSLVALLMQLRSPGSPCAKRAFRVGANEGLCILKAVMQNRLYMDIFERRGQESLVPLCITLNRKELWGPPATASPQQIFRSVCQQRCIGLRGYGGSQGLFRKAVNRPDQRTANNSLINPGPLRAGVASKGAWLVGSWSKRVHLQNGLPRSGLRAVQLALKLLLVLPSLQFKALQLICCV